MFFKPLKWAMLWALFILFLCGMPGKDIPHIPFLSLLQFDKFVHASIFFVLILLTIRGFIVQTQFQSLNNFPKVIALILCVIYGGSLEIMQATIFVDRSADIDDFIANSFGALMGLWAYKGVEKRVLMRLIK